MERNDECIVTQIARILPPPPKKITMMVGCILFDVLFENIVFVCKRHITGEGCNIKAFDF